MADALEQPRYGPAFFKGIVWHTGFLVSGLALDIIELAGMPDDGSRVHSVTNVFQVILLVAQCGIVAVQLIDFSQKGGVFSQEGAVMALNIGAMTCFVALNILRLASINVTTEAATFLTCVAAVLQMVYTRLEQVERRNELYWQAVLAHSARQPDEPTAARLRWLSSGYDTTVLVGTFFIVASRLVAESGGPKSHRVGLDVLLGLTILIFLCVSATLWVLVKYIVADVSLSLHAQDVEQSLEPANTLLIPVINLQLKPSSR